MIQAIIEIVAKNPPCIAIALAGFLAIAGEVGWAIAFLGVGVFLQIIWLLKR